MSRRKRPRGSGKLTQRVLENAALRYLQRYAATAQSLRQVLMRRVERAAREHATDRAGGARMVAALIARYERAGLLDDRAFALGRARRLHEFGTSRRQIAAKLRLKGVAAKFIVEALAALEEDDPEPELAAAWSYVRRRRLGPYRRPSERTTRRDNDMAALARAGFTLEAARAVIDAEEAG